MALPPPPQNPPLSQSSGYGGILLRSLAQLADFTILLVAAMVLKFDSGIITGTFVLALLSLFYFPLFWSSSLRATPGKMLFGLKVVTIKGERITLSTAYARLFGVFVSISLLGIGFLLLAGSSEKATLHDRIADTRVIYTRNPMQTVIIPSPTTTKCETTAHVVAPQTTLATGGPAGVWRRFIALICDICCLYVLMKPINAAVNMLIPAPESALAEMDPLLQLQPLQLLLETGGGLPELLSTLHTTQSQPTLDAFSMALTFVICCIWFPLFWQSKWRATPGMLIAHYHIVDDGNRDGQLSLEKSTMRFIASLLGFASLGIGFFMGALRADRKMVQDVLVSTSAVMGHAPALDNAPYKKTRQHGSLPDLSEWHEGLYASFGKRFWALVIDVVLFFIGYGILASFIALIIGERHFDSLEPAFKWAMAALYYNTSLTSSWQATFGKRCMDIYVTDIYGRRPNAKQTVIRFASSLLSAAPFFAGFIIAENSPEKATLHDLLAGTRVLVGRPPEPQ